MTKKRYKSPLFAWLCKSSKVIDYAFPCKIHCCDIIFSGTPFLANRGHRARAAYWSSPWSQPCVFRAKRLRIGPRRGPGIRFRYRRVLVLAVLLTGQNNTHFARLRYTQYRCLGKIARLLPACAIQSIATYSKLRDLCTRVLYAPWIAVVREPASHYEIPLTLLQKKKNVLQLHMGFQTPF